MTVDCVRLAPECSSMRNKGPNVNGNQFAEWRNHWIIRWILRAYHKTAQDWWQWQKAEKKTRNRIRSGSPFAGNLFANISNVYCIWILKLNSLKSVWAAAMAMVVVVAMPLYPLYLFAIQIRVIDTSEICMECVCWLVADPRSPKYRSTRRRKKASCNGNRVRVCSKSMSSIQFDFFVAAESIYFIDFYSPRADCLATAKYLVPKRNAIHNHINKRAAQYGISIPGHATEYPLCERKKPS